MSPVAPAPNATDYTQQESLTFAVELLASMPGAAAILNRRRELLAANADFSRRFLSGSDQEAVGQSPGVILQCVNPGPDNGGCGHTSACASCGLLHALVQAAGGDVTRARCAIERAGSLPVLDLAVRIRPLDVGGERFLIVSVLD